MNEERMKKMEKVNAFGRVEKSEKKTDQSS